MAKVASKKKLQFWGTGRRKKAVARVRLIPGGAGNIVINKEVLTITAILKLLNLSLNNHLF